MPLSRRRFQRRLPTNTAAVTRSLQLRLAAPAGRTGARRAPARCRRRSPAAWSICARSAVSITLPVAADQEELLLALPQGHRLGFLDRHHQAVGIAPLDLRRRRSRAARPGARAWHRCRGPAAARRAARRWRRGCRAWRVSPRPCTSTVCRLRPSSAVASSAISLATDHSRASQPDCTLHSRRRHRCAAQAPKPMPKRIDQRSARRLRPLARRQGGARRHRVAPAARDLDRGCL